MPEQPGRWREYIEAHVTKEPCEDGTECWNWTGRTGKDRNGSSFPAISSGRSGTYRAARIAYEEYTGPVPDGRRIFRSCGNELCVSPEHLLALTYAEERALRKKWRGTEVVLQIDIRADGTAYAYALDGTQEGRLKKVRGAESLGNGEFLLLPGMVRINGLKSHETKHQYVKNARERLGDAGDGHYARGVQERGWDKFREEEQQFLGVQDELDIG